MGICPACEGEVLIPQPHRGAVVTCPECGASLLVVSVLPLILEELDDEEEFWEEGMKPGRETEEEEEEEEE